MKIKNKGKVYPSPSSSSSFSSSSSTCSNGAAAAAVGGGGGDYLSVLTLLPAAIIALASVLPIEDREVLAYLIMRSMKTTVSFSSSTAATSPPSFPQKKPTKKTTNNCSGGGGSNTAHKAPGLYCDCFDCYTSFWFRWDSSPNRELIHQAIEAYEDHLTSGESEKSKKNGKAKRRDKTARRFAANDKQALDVPGPGRPDTSVLIKQVEELEGSSGSMVLATAAAAAGVGVVLPENEVPPEKKASSAEENEAGDAFKGSSPAKDATEEVLLASTAATSCSTHHKGLARKVLPDVLGLFNSRLWSLWSPNV